MHTRMHKHTHCCERTSVTALLQMCEVWADQEVTSQLPYESLRSKVRGIRAASAINGATVRALKCVTKHTQICRQDTALTQLPEQHRVGPLDFFNGFLIR